MKEDKIANQLFFIAVILIIAVIFQVFGLIARKKHLYEIRDVISVNSIAIDNLAYVITVKDIPPATVNVKLLEEGTLEVNPDSEYCNAELYIRNLTFKDNKRYTFRIPIEDCEDKGLIGKRLWHTSADIVEFNVRRSLSL